MHRRRDYQRKSFKNPYYLSKPKAKKKSRHKLGWLLLILLVFGLAYFFVAKPFRLDKIEISGNQYVGNNEIQAEIGQQLNKRRWLIFSQSNILFFDSNQAKINLLAKFFFENLEIKKKYFHTISILVTEKKSYLSWVSAAQNYFLDLNGVVIKKEEGTDLFIQQQGDNQVVRPQAGTNSYPIIYDQSNSPLKIGQAVISKELINFIVDLTQQVELNADFDISHFNISSPQAKDISLITKDGWEVRFSLEESVKTQIDLLTSVLHQQIKDHKKLKYIDLRFGEKVFYQ
ncbi:MAG: cell division protein FtsQ/DivIB [Patescibacteria group bacterium]